MEARIPIYLNNYLFKTMGDRVFLVKWNRKKKKNSFSVSFSVCSSSETFNFLWITFVAKYPSLRSVNQWNTADSFVKQNGAKGEKLLICFVGVICLETCSAVQIPSFRQAPPKPGALYKLMVKIREIKLVGIVWGQWWVLCWELCSIRVLKHTWC